MKQKGKIRKEQGFLTDNKGNGMLEEGVSQVKNNNEDLELNSDISMVLESQKASLTNTDKEILGNRISKSISAYKLRNYVVRIGSAAVLLILLGISALVYKSREPEISIYARNSGRINSFTNTDTRLILSGKKEVLIKSNDAKIAYVSESNKIKVDTGIVNQAIEGNEMVYNTVIVPYGKRTQITLSDNSSVWLNSGSKLVYPVRFANNKREVYLEGEAIFEVSHNKLRPFHVITQDVEVKVLGTVFDLSAYSDDKTTSTVLESGSVEMKDLSTNMFSLSKVTMVPGTMAVYNKVGSKITQTEVDVKQYTSWRDGYISCQKRTLGDILKKISRYYNVSIQLSDKTLEDETFTGNLDLRNSAQQVLSILSEFINIKFERTDNQILITRI